MGKKVFLSYAYQDRGIAKQMSRLLKEHGHDTDDMSFIDPQVDTEIGGRYSESDKAADV